MAKRLLALLCAAALLSLAACGKTAPPETVGRSSAPAEVSRGDETAPEETESQPASAAPDDASGPAGYGDASAGSARDMGVSVLHAAFAEDVDPAPGSYDEISVSDAPTARVVFSVDAEITDFQVLRLSLRGVSEDGAPEFLTTEVYAQETLSPNRPLVVSMAFAGDIPTNGISFTNAEGYTYRLALDLSGEDGSLVLTEF